MPIAGWCNAPLLAEVWGRSYVLLVRDHVLFTRVVNVCGLASALLMITFGEQISSVFCLFVTVWYRKAMEELLDG